MSPSQIQRTFPDEKKVSRTGLGFHIISVRWKPNSHTERHMTRSLGALLVALSLACSDGKLERSDVRGSMWVASVGDTTGPTRGHVMLEFSDSAASMVPLYANAMRYAIVRDTIFVFTEQGPVRFSFHTDSLTDESFGWVFHRAR
jgi:hypothetical protein